MLRNITKVFKAPSTLYVIIRYITYILQFINAVLLARNLNEFEFGVYSFILLFMQYMSYTNLGINESLNTEYAIHKGSAYQNNIWDNAWTINIILNIIITIVCIGVFTTNQKLFSTYQFNNYKYQILFTCIIINLSKVYITYYKLHGKLFKLNIQQILPNIIIAALLLIYGKRLTISHITSALLWGNVVPLILFRINIPQAPKFKLSLKWIRILLKRGITLLLYNLSFYFLIMLAASMVSAYYSVEVFGTYSFANTIVNGVVMAGGAFLFIFYPKILNRMNTDISVAKEIITKIRTVYVVFMDFISLLSIIFICLIPYIIPHYGIEMIIIYSILMLGRIINNASTAYAALLIAKGKESTLVVYGCISICIMALCGICTHIAKLNIESMALSVTIASLIYTYLVTRKGLYMINATTTHKQIFREIFGMNKWLACSIILINAYIFHSYYILVSSIIIYSIANMHNIKHSIKLGMDVITNKKALSF